MRHFLKSAEQNWTLPAVIAGSIMFAILLGTSVASQASSGASIAGIGTWILLGFGTVWLGAITLLAPIELILVAGMLGPILADARFVPAGFVYYARFVPMGMLTVRTFSEFLVKRRSVLPIIRTFLFPSLPILLLAFVSSIYGIEPEKILQRAVSMLFIWVCFGIGLPSFWQTPRQIEQGLKWVTGLLIIVLAVGFVLYDVNPQNEFYQYEFIRLRGIFANPNTEGLMAMLCVFPALWWWQAESHLLRRVIVGLGVLLALALVVVAGSRASFFGTAIGALAFVGISGRVSIKTGAILLLFLIAIGIFVLFDPVYGRAILLQGDPDRLFLWQRSVELGMRAPIWGVGLGASDLLYAADIPYLRGAGIATSGSHNSYFRMFVDLGIVGVALGFLVFIVVLTRVFTAERAIRHDRMVTFLSSAVVAGLVNAAFEDWLFGFGSASTPVMWFFLALLALRIEMLSREERVSRSASAFSSAQPNRFKP